MIKIFSALQIKKLDQFTIEHEPVSSIDLMERACKAFVNWFIERFDSTHKIGIICGTGNNGGDGLGIARLLLEWNYPVKVWILKGGKESDDFKINFERLYKLCQVVDMQSPVDVGQFHDCSIVIDAIFGTGLTRPVEGLAEEVIAALNQLHSIRIAVDVPSGLQIDHHSTGEIFAAHYTVTFQNPKLAFLLPENSTYVGEWHAVDIGLSKNGTKELLTDYVFVSLKDARRIYKPRKKFDHKGKFGHALLIAGSSGKMGACVLSAKAALRAGVGLLTLHVPIQGNVIAQTSVPEAMCEMDKHEHWFSSIEDVNRYNVIGVGPGLGKHTDSSAALQQLLTNYKRPLVIDADALNLIAKNPDLLSLIPEGSILTPHPKEFERLAGKTLNDFDRLLTLKRFSARYKVVTVLKGAYTAIAAPSGEVYFNSTGNPGMATAGSGDVLTGIVTSLLAQHYTPIEAAILAVFIHGLSGDIAARDTGIDSLIASDIIEFLPNAFKKLV